MAVLEISDLIAAWDPGTGARQPIAVADVTGRLRAAGDHRAARIVERMPATSGVLEPESVDRLLVRVHTELQRLAEELHMAERFVELLRPMLDAARSAGFRRLRVVDIGCGIGYVIRWLATTRVLGADVELLGVDQNPVLIAEASRLALDEGLPCGFACADAFALAEDATVYISSGVLHHFPVDELGDFFRAQDRPGTAGFIHYDIAATRLAPAGAWVFHRARMRELLGRHDGVNSARRAHGDRTLVTAAGQVGTMDIFLFAPIRHTNPFCAAMRPVVGIRPELSPALRRLLGRRARALHGTDDPVPSLRAAT
ncbi:class I SAM-dependent methyltransferase [Actinospica robiniae]|uniref:class I SAM-dependent methyltransferase n=1 Tax=Actinospica robiniae TaxID=304901 RepID=UPI000418B959|nr:class I SAM-dependent methyltransferase [Actinospica robiniae]